MVENVRQNLKEVLAALGLGLAVVTGGVVTAQQEMRADQTQVVYRDAPWTDGGILYGATVCARDQGWWADFCAAHASGLTLVVDASNPHQRYMVAHEASHALLGRTGPPSDPNREAEAHAAGCRAEWVVDWCEQPQVRQGERP